MVVSLFNSRIPSQGQGHGGMVQDDLTHHAGTMASNATALNSTSNQFHYLSPSPGIVINEESKMPTDSIEIMTEAPTPLSPKGLQFRQKLFPQNLPSPIPRSLPYSSPSPSPLTPAPSYATHSLPPSQRGALMAPASPKSHQQHSSSLHHDKHLSPFKSDHFQGRILRTAVKNRLNNHLRQKADPRNSPASMMGGVSGGMGGATGGIASDHLTNRFITSHASNSGRLVTSSPLVKLSMSSSLEEGGGAVGAGFRGLPMPRRRVSDASVESGGGSGGREESLMESSDCESVDSVEPGAGVVVGTIDTAPGHGQEEKRETAPELNHMTS